MKGLSYPFRIEDGAPASDEDEDLVVSALNQLFAQKKGERPYDAPNGVDLEQYIFENEEEIVKANARRSLALSASRNEGRIEILATNAKFSQQGKDTVIELKIVYRFRNQNFELVRPVRFGGE